MNDKINIIKAPTKEEIIELEKQHLTGNGELRDLLPIVGIGDGPVDYEKRSILFWAEIEFLNEEIERLGGKKREYIMTNEQKIEARLMMENMKKFEEENGDKIKSLIEKMC